MPHPIDRTTLHAAIQCGWATVIDARPATHYRVGHLPCALNLTVETAATWAPELVPDRDALIATYSTDVRCFQGDLLAEALEDLGYTDLRVYAGGVEDWLSAGLPVVRPRAGRAPTPHLSRYGLRW